MEAVVNWPAVEVLLLVEGLPASSRYVGRHLGEDNQTGWDVTDWLLMDMRNAMESVRAMLASVGKKSAGNQFREWTNYPGREAMERAKREAKRKRTMDILERLAVPVTE